MRYRYDPKNPVYSGHGIPVFTGMDFHRGHGVGGLLSSLIRRAIPFVLPTVKQIGKRIGKKLLHSGAQIAQDVVLHKKPLKTAMRQRGSEALAELLEGNHRSKRKKRSSKPAHKKNIRKRQQRPDIFN